MKEYFAMALGVAVGAFFAYFWFGTDSLIDHQKGYKEGRESVLEQKIVIGEKGTPCYIEVPVSAIQEMINAGILQWEQKCEDLQ